MLSSEQVDRFIADGFVRVDRAFPRELAERCCELLWTKTGCDPDDPSTWTKPVVWLMNCDEPPFVEAANTPTLHRALDQLVGPNRWQPRTSLGAFPIRFPADEDTGDTGWHIDTSFPAPDSEPDDYQTWHVNVRSRDRALLMLFLFSDVGENDAPTRIRRGSHQIVARMLEPAGEAGVRSSTIDFTPTSRCPELSATGAAGTVYLCHPFLVHAARINRGRRPRFLAQPTLQPSGRFRVDGSLHEHLEPVEIAIAAALRGMDARPQQFGRVPPSR